MDSYNQLVYKLGTLHSLLRELEATDQLQGEHTIVYTGADGVRQTLHVYIDGTDLQMSNTTGNLTGLNLFNNAIPEED
jgi:VCBS repeat-containing protein